MGKWMMGAALLAAAATAGSDDRHVAVRPGESLHVVTAGTGDPVVLLPGILASGYGFRRVVGPLVAAGHQAIVIEPLGVGGSSRPPAADYSLTAQADRVDVVLSAMGVERAVIVAHSVGASIAFRLAIRHPERVAAIVSLDGGPAESASTPGFRRAMTFVPLLKLFGGMGRIRGLVRRSLVERSADPAWVTDAVVEGYLGEGARDLDVTLDAYRQIARAREPEALQPRLCEVRCPVRLVIGTATRVGGISPAEIGILERSLPALAIDRVPAAGHFVCEEQPAAVVAAVEQARAESGAPPVVLVAHEGTRP